MSGFEFRFEGVAGVAAEAPSSRGGAVSSVLPPSVLTDTSIEVVGKAASFELNPATSSRGGDWSGRAGFVEVDAPVESAESELLVVRCGGGYRVVRSAGGADRLVYRVPVSPGPGVDRGPFGAAVRWVVQKVVVPLAGDAASHAGERLVSRWELARRPSQMRYFTPALYRTAKAEPVDVGQLRPGRVLLLLHGINAQSHDANGLGAMSRELVEELNREYEQVIAFDHPTLATSPTVNAEELAAWLRSAGPGIERVDVLCHSRGGLVARYLIENLASDIPFGSVLFVATPHRGTELADPDHIGGFVDRLLTLALAVPDNPVSIAVEGVLTVAKEVVGGVAKHLDGITCMTPGGTWLSDLSSGAPDGVSYRAIAADFETAPGSGWWHSWKDRGVDLVFGGLPNDVVVPTLSALQIGDQPGGGFADMVVFDDLDAVVHSRYFGHQLVQPVIKAWLGRKASPLPPELSSRRRTPDDVRALAQLGPEWSLARRIIDLTCLAPEATRPALQAKLEKFGARVWKAVTGRGETGERSTVVLLPGIMGSELQADDRRVWLSPWQLAQGGFEHLRLDDGDLDVAVHATEMLCFAYRQFLEHFREEYDVVEFPYDWRHSVDVSARSLLDMLTELVASRDGDDHPPAHIVAHSMGGLVVRRARQLAAAEDVSDEDPFSALGGRVVLLGTPNHGSFAAPLALVGRHALVSNLARLDLRLGRQEWLELIWTFPGLVELLPDPEGVASETTPGVRLDWLYEPGRWPDRAGTPRLRQRLGAAGEFHDALRKSDGLGLHLVLGDGLPTPVGLRPVGMDRFEVQLGNAGDGTVALSCGHLRNATTIHYAHGTSHGDLVRDRKVLAAVGELLEFGQTGLLRNTPHSSDRGTAASLGIPWLAPDVAELETDVTARRSRGLVTGLAPPPAWTRADVLEAGLDAVSGFLARPTVHEFPDLVISVVHGSLECAAHPILIGHGTGTPVAGAEARCDELLGNELSELNVLGSYPDRRGSHLYVPRTRPEHRLEGCVIVALDSTAPLSTGELAEQVCRAVVDYAERRRWERLRDNDHSGDGNGVDVGLSAVPVGSGPAVALGLERSIDAVVSGVQRANAILTAQGRPSVKHLEFVERYAGKVERVMWALQRLQERVNTTPLRGGRIDLGDRQIRQGEGALAGVPPPSYENGRWERLSVDVEVRAEPGDQIRRLTYRFARDRAAVSDRPRRVDRRVVAELLTEAVRRPSRSLALGAVLFEELLPAELKDELARTDNLVLQVDALTADLPWELLVDRLAGNEPLACRAGLLRQFRTNDLSPRTGSALARSALVFGDPPTEFMPLPGARQEANEVWRLMRNSQIEAQLLEFDEHGQDGQSSAARIKEAFRARDHRIIHIAAHGLYRVPDQLDDDYVEGGVAIGDGAFLTADDFANLRVAPDLVFLNCCYLGKVRPGNQVDVSGLLDPVDQHQAVASIAKRLMDIGVRAVLVAGWAVDDEAGKLFATEFYRGLLDGRPYGDAVRNARLTVYRQFDQGNNTWAAYQCYGDPGFQLSTPNQGFGTATEISLRAAASRQLEELYVRAGESRDADDLTARLKVLDGEIARRWPQDGELIGLCGRLWGDLGRYAEAIEHYEQAITSGSGGSLHSVEQLVNLAARHAVVLQRENKPRKQIDACLGTAKKWAAVVESLGETSERRSIIASLEKRLAVLEPEEWSGHLTKAVGCYIAAAEQAKQRTTADERDLYGFRNAIQLAGLLIDKAELVDSLLTKGWIERWASDLIASGRRSGSFWSHVSRADSMLTAALIPSESVLASRIAAHATALPEIPGAHQLRDLLISSFESSLTELSTAYLTTRSRGRIREWNSIVENTELLRDLAVAGQHSSAHGLDSLADILDERHGGRSA